MICFLFIVNDFLLFDRCFLCLNFLCRFCWLAFVLCALLRSFCHDLSSYCFIFGWWSYYLGSHSFVFSWRRSCSFLYHFLILTLSRFKRSFNILLSYLRTSMHLRFYKISRISFCIRYFKFTFNSSDIKFNIFISSCCLTL